MRDKTLNQIVEQYIKAMRAITNANTSEERIALRNALIDNPMLYRIYVSRMEVA